MNIKIDPTKLLGFKLVAADLAAAGTVAGAKIGNKPPLNAKAGSKVGAKPGFKPQRP